MKLTAITVFCALLTAASLGAQPTGALEIGGHTVPMDRYLEYLGKPSDPAWKPRSWGDQGNGTYINPVLNADFSDPDVIRAGGRYYLVASDFHFLGMQLLESEDLVNWRYVTQIYDHFDTGGWDRMTEYGNGSWAPAIRWHDGRFHVYFCSPTEGLYHTAAEKPEGPWSPLERVYEGSGWEDPCPFWDEDGQAYLGHSRVGAGPIILHRMSQDGTKLLDDGIEVYNGPVAEGTKIFKKDGYYYFSIPEGGVGQGSQVVLRSANIYGPYEKRTVLEKGSTQVNGPHQGALVDTPDGQWWFLHFQQTPILGRVMHLQPVLWSEDVWPLVGVDIDRNGVGEPVFAWAMPSGDSAPSKPAASDDFSSAELGPQWQFNHNPVKEALSLTERKGFLTSHALRADAFHLARNTLTQKLMGPAGQMELTLDLSGMEDGQRCGFALMGQFEYLLGVRQESGKRYVYMESSEGREVYCRPWQKRAIRLRADYDVYDLAFSFCYSADGKNWIRAGEPFLNIFGNWKGVRPALYNYNPLQEAGKAYFDSFVYDYAY